MSTERLGEIRRLQHEAKFLERIVAQGDRNPVLKQLLEDFRYQRGVCRLRLRALVAEFCETWKPKHLRILPRITSSEGWMASALEPHGFGFIPGVGIDDVWIQQVRWSIFHSVSQRCAMALSGRSYRTDRVYMPKDSWNEHDVPGRVLLGSAGIPSSEHDAYISKFKGIRDVKAYYIGLRVQIIDVLTAVAMRPPELIRMFGGGVFSCGELDVPDRVPRAKRVRSSRPDQDSEFDNTDLLLAYQSNLEEEAAHRAAEQADHAQ